MSIPTVIGKFATLPFGRYRATLDEIEQVFVHDAPFAAERAQVFQAFHVWFSLMDGMLPGARYWVDGGFVTHKDWAAPSDVDVMMLCTSEQLNALNDQEQERFAQLLTVAAPGTPRVQPMGGLVDAYYVVRGNVDHVIYWQNLWSKVRDRNGNEVLNSIKGFVEVMA